MPMPGQRGAEKPITRHRWQCEQVMGPYPVQKLLQVGDVAVGRPLGPLPLGGLPLVPGARLGVVHPEKVAVVRPRDLRRFSTVALENVGEQPVEPRMSPQRSLDTQIAGHCPARAAELERGLRVLPHRCRVYARIPQSCIMEPPSF